MSFYSTVSSLPFESSLPSTSDSNSLQFDNSCSESTNLDTSSPETSHQLASAKMMLDKPLPSNTVSSKANSLRTSKNKRSNYTSFA